MVATFIPDDDLDARAVQLLATYEKLYGQIVAPPVPIDLILETVLDITIDWTEIASPDPDNRVLARIRLTSSGRMIEMNTLERAFFDQHFGTVAYSKAHEAGHAVLHLPSSLTRQAPLLTATGETILCRSDRHDRQEIQAERFAAFLLMPEHLVHSAVADHAIVSWPQVYALRDLFGVSLTAMRLRLTQLNVLYVDPTGRVFPSREAATGQQSLW